MQDSLGRVSTSTGPSVGVGVVLLSGFSLSSVDGDSAGRLNGGGLMRLHSVNALVNQRAARRRTVGRARLGCNLGNGTAQDLDLSGGAAVPAQRLQPHKPSHRRGEETVENPEVSVCVGPEDLETTDTKLTVDHGKRLRKLNPRRVGVGGGRTFFSLVKTSL